MFDINGSSLEDNRAVRPPLSVESRTGLFPLLTKEGFRGGLNFPSLQGTKRTGMEPVKPPN